MEFQHGDYVRHKTGKYNHGLQMEVTGIRDNEVRCDWFEGTEATHKSVWMTDEEVVLVSNVDGGFRNAGE